MKLPYVLFLFLLVSTCLACQTEGAPPADSYRSAASQADSFELPDGFQIELVVSEPDLINPLGMALDGEGRIYVSESHTYRYDAKDSPVSPPTNPIIRLDPTEGGTGYRRTIVAEGFEDPVFGLLIRDGNLWCTNNDRLFRFDVDDQGNLSNRKTLLKDANKVWNPFGMYTMKWGRDGLLYLSVSNHDIDISGPTNRLRSRGSSGLVARMRSDGSKIERLVDGMRAPYPYELDPFGRLWVISNGEGNPNRFLHAIVGVDYHCYSRPAVDNEWLAGRNPLAPPCTEMSFGACTQLMWYDAANFPVDYRGNLLIANWGAHGFSSPNHTIYRYILDENGQVTSRNNWLTCTDPHFRPTYMLLDHDGSLLVTDWYGRDDESDRTGRIWRISYSGPDRPKVHHTVANFPWDDDKALATTALNSPDHLIRSRAASILVNKGNSVVPMLLRHVEQAPDPIAAANALWVLFRIGTGQAHEAIATAVQNDDPRLRHLAITLLSRSGCSDLPFVSDLALADPDEQVRLAAALTLRDPRQIRMHLIAAIHGGGAHDSRTRYKAAWHLARYANEPTFKQLLNSPEADIRLTGLIAIDVACYEGFASGEAATRVLGDALADPGELDLSLLLTLARINELDAVPALEQLLTSPNTSPAILAEGIQLLLSNPDKRAQSLAQQTRTRLFRSVRNGTTRLESVPDKLAYMAILEPGRLTPSDTKHLSAWLVDDSPEVRVHANSFARIDTANSDATTSACWQHLLDTNPPLAPECTLALAATLLALEPIPNLPKWKQLIEKADPILLNDIVRSWRHHATNPEAVSLLAEQAPSILARVPSCRQDLNAVVAHFKTHVTGEPSEVSTDPKAKKALSVFLNKANLKGANPLLGRRVFERTGCLTCHPDGSDSLRGPPLEGLAAGQPRTYFIESLLNPSKVIKTGFETEIIETNKGQIMSGVVRQRGAKLEVVTPDKIVTLTRQDIAERRTQKISLMPEGQEHGLSRTELVDLLAYLMSLK